MADLNEMLVAWTGEIDSFMYTYILVILLVFVGVYYTIRTKAVQIRYIKDMFTQLTEKKHVQGERSISSFQALMVSTASRVGTGNIAGVATAVATGGPGAVFWMWLMAHRRRGVGLRRVHARADLQGARQGGRVPRRPGLLHSSRRLGPALARHPLRLGCSSCASPSASTACRPSTCHFGARVLHPRLRHQRHGRRRAASCWR